MTRLYSDASRSPPDEAWIITRTLTGAIRVLATGEVATINLDHDISHHVSAKGTGLYGPQERVCGGAFPPGHLSPACFRRAMVIGSTEGKFSSAITVTDKEGVPHASHIGLAVCAAGGEYNKILQRLYRSTWNREAWVV
jgi:hypothetical protein